MTDHADTRPVIGKDISWEQLATSNMSGLLLATEFARFATVRAGEVKSPSVSLPYGTLSVRCLEMKSEFSLYVTHKLDFLNLWDAYELCGSKALQSLMSTKVRRLRTLVQENWGQTPDVYSRLWDTQGAEVIVGKFTDESRGLRKSIVAKILGGMMPQLFVMVCPRGYAERAVSENWEGLSGSAWAEAIRPLAQWSPETTRPSNEEEAIYEAWQDVALTSFRRYWGIGRQVFLALLHEFEDLETAYEPPRDHMSKGEVDSLFKSIASSDELTQDEKAVADFALLAVLEGSVPSLDGLSCLKTVFGHELVQTILAKQAQSNGETNNDSDSHE
jgi:hypothetical protein